MIEPIAPSEPTVQPVSVPAVLTRAVSTPADIVVGICDLVTSALVLYGVFVALPARYAPIDGIALLVVSALAVSGVGLLGRRSWAKKAARVAGAAVLFVGLVLIAMLAMTASYLFGIYDQVGRGGATILVLVSALAFPYLVVFPALQLYWARPTTSPGKATL